MSKFKKLCVFTKADGRMIAGKIGYVDDAGDYVVVADTNMYVSDHEDYARKMAAAPDLIHALNLALEYWQDRQQRYKNRVPVWVKEARAAIEKATGKEMK